MLDQLDIKNEMISHDSRIRVIEDQGGKLYIEFEGHLASDFLPQGYSFITSDYMYCDHDSRQVGVDVRQLDGKYFLLDVLHEAGHAIRDAEDDNRKDTEINERLRSLEITPKGDTEYTNMFREWVEIVERRERNAWLYSLEVVWKLIDKGFDIRQTFTDFDDFKSKILKDYKSYRSGMKHVYAKSGRGTIEQYKMSFDYVDQTFDKHITDLEDMLQTVWNH